MIGVMQSKASDPDTLSVGVCKVASGSVRRENAGGGEGLVEVGLDMVVDGMKV